MRLIEEKRKQLENRGGELYRLALTENRKLTDQEQTELRGVERQLDADEYEGLYGEPPKPNVQQPSDGQRRFAAPVETRGTEKRRILTAEHRMAEHVRGSYPAEFDGLSIGRLLRGYLTGEWAGAELEARAMASSPTTAGGILIPTPLSARIIDKARNLAAVMRAGAVTVPMTTATLKMGRLTADFTAAWYDEAGAISASDGTLDSVTFTARKLAALVVVNNELLEDAQGIDDVVENSLARALALKLDYTALFGSGTPPEPKGLYSDTDATVIESVGTPSNFAKFVEAIFDVRGENHEPNAVLYSARTAETLAGLVTGITGDNTPLAAPADFAALTKFVTNQIPDSLSYGSPVTTENSAAFVGQWNQMAVGVRSNLVIEVAREGAYNEGGTVYSAFQKDQTLIRAILRADVQRLQPKAFCVMKGITVAS